ncbi:hypothetical protein HDC93_003040 [Streptomyces sp. AK010]|nr:hypothetical protein [Streptomyces sp. AK010]
MNTGQVTPGVLVAGAAHVEATLMELCTFSGLPLPSFHAVQGQDVTLTWA